MDVVDTVNHLTPSDQLDDNPSIITSLSSDSINELEAGLVLDESLKNMLSDKDPMFGCSQFNLLDQEDAAYPGSTDLDVTLTPAGLHGEVTAVKRPVGRPRKRPVSAPEHGDGSITAVIRGRAGRRPPVDRLQTSFLIHRGVAGARLKDELTLGGRINVHDLDGGRWMNPTVVLRRLTVTIGGFKIELLPGPSYTHTVDSASADDMSYCDDVGFTVTSDNTVTIETPAAEETSMAEEMEASSAEDLVLGLGPYVDPNEVQTSNGSVSTEEPPLDNHRVPGDQGVVGEEVTEQISENNTATSVAKEKPPVSSKTPVRSKPGLTVNKTKDLVSSKERTKDHVVSPNSQSKNVVHKSKALKDKKDVAPLKRPAENTPGDHAVKVLKVQTSGDPKAKPKLPSSPTSVGKKSPSFTNRVGDPHTPARPPAVATAVAKAEATDPGHGRPSQAWKTPEEVGPEKPRAKKPEKIHQRQKSRNSQRSVSVDEPVLFIPDNAPPIAKKEVEEQPVNSETLWDGNNCCGLCKKHHNNMFMVGCGRCDDWFHGDCVGLDLSKVREMEEEDQMYVCLKCCEEESQKPELQSPTKAEVPDHNKPPPPPPPPPPPKPRPGPSQVSPGGVKTPRKDPDRRHSADSKDTTYKPAFYTKHETKSKSSSSSSSSSSSKKPVSVEAIRRSVRDSLREILLQRLKDSNVNISTERAGEVAKKTERELFHLYKDTDNKYKNKYRSLMFNLKDSKNNVLFRRVLKGEISPETLIRMSPEELASKELAAWRQRENRHTIEMIEKEQREVERRPITKITHKGEIEIESQEPVKAPEAVDLEPPPKVTEVSAEPPKSPEKNTESEETERDTTSRHKSHLFDLHCKICTGRMAPPVEEAPTKVVATTVVRRTSVKTEENKSSAPSAMDDDLHLSVLEESFRSAQSGFDLKSEPGGGRDEELSFLSSLKSLWRGFIHMHSVAKLVTKAFPVSGVLENLTEDLPDSIQVGGRISPGIVWDYLEKIRAMGTKEVCLIRFAPETDEDEISYTLLYAYFSSRRRFGVVSNNLKQVKDMYLIPLGATEKVPHQLVPFDGPGLEPHRSNLLLGLIIRQRPKRDFLTVEVNESISSISSSISVAIVPEVKPVAVSAKESRPPEEEEEKFFLSTLITAQKKEKEKVPDEAEAEGAAAAGGEAQNPEAQKPLRFLPGVLLGWGGELPPLPDVGENPAVRAYNALKTQPPPAPPPKAEASPGVAKSPTAALPTPRDRFVIKKKEVKNVNADVEQLSSPTEASGTTHVAQISLKDKPPDVSTEAFLSSLAASRAASDGGSAASVTAASVTAASATATAASATAALATTGDSISAETEQEASDGTKSKPPAASDPPNGSKPLSGILKKTSVCSSDDNTTEKTAPYAPTAAPVLHTEKTAPYAPKAAPVPSSTRRETLTTFHQGCLQLSQAKNRPVAPLKEAPLKEAPLKEAPLKEAPLKEAPLKEAPLKEDPLKEDPLKEAPSVVPRVEQEPPSAPPPPPALQQQTDSTDSASDAPSTPTPPGQNHSRAPGPPGAEPQPPESDSQLPPPSSAKEQRRHEEQYMDPWERPRNTEERSKPRDRDRDRDGKKGRHHERDKKHERDDKHRERSRHGHSDERYGDKRKERHHGEDHGGRHKDRHRHRRDSDYENGRRSSRDSYS